MNCFLILGAIFMALNIGGILVHGWQCAMVGGP